MTEITFVCTNEQCQKRWKSASGKTLTNCKACKSPLAAEAIAEAAVLPTPKVVGAADVETLVAREMTAEEASAMEGFMAGYTNGFSSGYDNGFDKGYDQAMRDMLRMGADEGDEEPDVEEA